MMVDKKLLSAVPEAPRAIAGHVALQWLGLLGSVAAVFSLTGLLGAVLDGTWSYRRLATTGGVVVAAVLLRLLCAIGAARLSHVASAGARRVLRGRLYDKLLRLGPGYARRVPTSEVVQLATEGVDQLETYFGRYLPQLFYSLLAPVTLFVVLAPLHLPAALVLLCCVPLIPLSIVAVQKLARRLLGDYWEAYAGLGDSFLENLQGLTTLKIYRTDEARHRRMNRQAERFRVATMRVLTMQLSSVTVMDVVAFGGAALGVILAALGLRAGVLELSGALTIVLLSAEFFLPLRLLGSYFHIAMNGMAASARLFRILELEEPPQGTETPDTGPMTLEDVTFSYDGGRQVLDGVSLVVPPRGFVSVCGVSGSGKSTLAGLLLGEKTGYGGSIRLGGCELRNVRREALQRKITRVGHDSVIFGGTVAENLRMGSPAADDGALEAVLRQVNLYQFLQAQQGLATRLTEGGSNLSGGQRQRLALARALLRDSEIYLFDEATSNIDAESENDIMAAIRGLAREKTVLLISHRLANAVEADAIYLLEDGKICEVGRHEELMRRSGSYARLYRAQEALEHYGERGEAVCEEAG